MSPSRHALPLLLLLAAAPVAAQGVPGVAVDGRGVTWSSPDGITRITMRFRIQQLMTVTSSEDEPFDPFCRKNTATRLLPEDFVDIVGAGCEHS